MDWNQYYSNTQTNQVMRAYARQYPNLTKIYSIGKSYEGVDLMVMEVTNKQNRPAEEKPALYVDGNIHAGELTGSAVTLYLMGHLLNNYGTDPAVTALLDTRTFYIRPKFNPDGADLALLEDENLRSSVRPWDNDNDGLLDEDPSEDLNGDGFITQMRIRDADGSMKSFESEPRHMVPRAEGETGGAYYRVVTEGIDNDGDGRLNEDGYGGLDLNRNFPRNWELAYLQPGAGPFPMSEPEVYNTVKFIDAHPNITGIVHNHTAGGFVYRLPSAVNPSTFPESDLATIQVLGAGYTESTGRPVQASSTDPTNHRYGTLISWGYWDRGIIGWVPEYWPGLASELEGTDQALEQFRINDEDLDGKYFVEWTPYRHEEFGNVEIGGWRTKYVSQNPPSEMLEEECAAQIPWILSLAERSPLLEITEQVVTSAGGNQFRISITARNSGFLPTNLTDRGIVAQVVPPVMAVIELQGAELVEGAKRVTVGHLAGSYEGSTPASSTARAQWLVETNADRATVRVTVISEKGGTVRTATIPLNN